MSNRPCIQGFKRHRYERDSRVCQRCRAPQFCPLCQRTLRLHDGGLTCEEQRRQNNVRVVKFARDLQAEIDSLSSEASR